MNRTLGFFLGSAVVFGMLVLILGQPVSLAPPVNRDIHTRTETTTSPIRIPAPVRQLEQGIRQPSDQNPASTVSGPASLQPAKQVAIATPSAASTDPLPQAIVVEPVKVPVMIEYQDENKLAQSWLKTKAETTQPEAAADLAVVDTTIDTTTDTTTVGPEKNPLAADNDPAVLPAVQPAVSEAHLEWFPVWDPFHSELSANAFARRLERVTGLDYRVIKTAPAQYRVVMGYSTEEQRSVNLTLIEQATGLSITGGSL